MRATGKGPSTTSSRTPLVSGPPVFKSAMRRSQALAWGGDMPHYSPPLPFWRGRVGCLCVLACACWLGGRGCTRWLACPGPLQGSRPRTCALAGGPAPVPGAGVAVGRAGWLAQARAWGRGRIRACWPEGPRPCLVQGSRSCALAGVPRPAPRVAAAYVRTGPWAQTRARRRGRGQARHA